MYFVSLGVKGLTWFVTNQYVLRSCIQKAPYIDTKIHSETQRPMGREACKTMAKDNSINNFFFHEKIVTTQSICMFCVFGDTVWSYNPANSNACGGFGSCVWSAMLHSKNIIFLQETVVDSGVQNCQNFDVWLPLQLPAYFQVFFFCCRSISHASWRSTLHRM